VPHVPPERAFDFWPTFALKLGPETLTVEPLSLGRFLRVCAVPAETAGALEKASAAMLSAVATNIGSEIGAALGKALAEFPPEALFSLVREVVPRLEEKAWNEYGGLGEAISLLNYFVGVHDWDLIGEELGSGEKTVETPSRLTVVAALTGLANLTGRKLEELYAMRVEGFFYFRRANKELTDRAKEAEEPKGYQPEELGIPVNHDPERLHGIWDTIARADAEAANG
jgi:hypothetical protein